MTRPAHDPGRTVATPVWAHAVDRRTLLRVGVGSLAAGSAAAFLAACGSDGNGTGAGTAGGGGGGAGGAADRLVVASARSAVGLDPDNVAGAAGVGVWLNFYDTLFNAITPADLDAARKAAVEGVVPRPMLASAWEPSADERTWRIELQPRALSQAGNELTAEDVVWSMERHLDMAYTAAFFLGLVGVTRASQFRAVDDKTVELRLPAAAPQYLLDLLGAPWVVIYDRAEVSRHATGGDRWASRWLDRNAAGFGPYRLESVSGDGATVQMRPTEGYWGDVKMRQITMRAVPESSGRLQLLLSGEAQLAEDLSPVQLDQVESNDATEVVNIATPGSVFLGFDCSKAPFDDPELRRAIASALDYDQIIETAYRGRAQRWKSVLPPFFQGATDEYWTYDGDADAARAALEPFAGTEIQLDYAAGSESQRQLAILVQAALRAAGLSIRINGMERAAYDTRRLGGELAFYIEDSSAPAIASSLYAFQQLYVSRPIQPILHYSDPQVDRLVDQLAAARESDEQNDLIGQLQEILVGAMPMIPVAYTGFHLPASTRVSGFESHNVNVIFSKDLALEA